MSIKLKLSDDVVIDVDNWKYSPFIKGLVDSKSSDDLGDNTYNASELLDYYTIDNINKYVNYINTGDVNVDVDFISIMKFMGHDISDIEMLYNTLSDKPMMSCSTIHRNIYGIDIGKIVSSNEAVIHVQNNVKVKKLSSYVDNNAYVIVGTKTYIYLTLSVYRYNGIDFPITYYKIDRDEMTINASINVVEDMNGVVTDDRGNMWRRQEDHLIMFKHTADSKIDHVVLDYEFSQSDNIEYVNIRLAGTSDNQYLMRAYNNIYVGKDDTVYRLTLDKKDRRYRDQEGLVDNYEEYVINYCTVYFKDTWIRDNMYSLDLFNDPLYGCVNLGSAPPDMNIVTILEFFRDIDIIIAGGYVLGMHKNAHMNAYSDIDIFVHGHENCDKIIERLKEKKLKPYITANSISFTIGLLKVQIILRCYSAPTEVIHGFDVDCSSIMLYRGRIYCTERCKLAIDTGCNMFNTRRLSTTYVNRLYKYNVRGLKVMFPNIMIVKSLYYRHHAKLTNLLDSTFTKGTMDRLINMVTSFVNGVGGLPNVTTSIYADLVDETKMNNAHVMLRNAGVETNYDNIVKYMALFYNSFIMIPKRVSQANLIILLLGNIKSSISMNNRRSDYSQVLEGDRYVKYDLDNITWKEQDPMTQVTSTFNPLDYASFDQYCYSGDYIF